MLSFLSGLSVGEVISILTVSGILVGMWYKLNNKVDNTENALKEIKIDIEDLGVKVIEHEKQNSAINTHLSTIQSQMATVNTRLDTILTYLLNLNRDK